MSDILIIGDGPAAHRLVERLRHHGHQDAVTVLGREPGPTHSGAPPLPFSGHSSPYQHGFPEGTRVRRGVTATRIDRARRLVHTDDGTAHGYDTLVLATGARPRVPDIPGVLTAEGRLHASVFTPRSLAARECRPAGSVAVLGAGAGGVEAALALRRAGREVALVDAASHPMKDRLDDAAGRLLAGILHDEGVETHLGHVAVAFEPGKLVLDGGRVLAADVLLLCTDAAPETGLAHGAGLSVDCGVLIDDEMRTDDPRIRAIGGCARHQEGGGETAYSLPQAWDQADTLALLLTGGRPHYRVAAPITRSRTPGVDVLSLGPPSALDHAAELVTLSDPSRRRYAKLALHDHKLTAAMVIGLPKAIASLVQLYDRGVSVPSDRLALLLGTSSVGSGTVELPDDAVVCNCNNVTKRSLAQAWHQGAREVAELAEATRATTGCGTCADAVRRICGVLEKASGEGDAS